MSALKVASFFADWAVLAELAKKDCRIGSLECRLLFVCFKVFGALERELSQDISLSPHLCLSGTTFARPSSV